MRILLTGGAGFIGSHLLQRLLRERVAEQVVTLDSLTYAGNRSRIAFAQGDPSHRFVHGDLTDEALLEELFATYDFDLVLHLAAETHVDRSLEDPRPFLRSNVLGVSALLESARRAWQGASPARRFLHVSTDEVYGEVPAGRPPVAEGAPYAPRNPYAASKAAGDHLVRAAMESHGFPAILTHATNNYGSGQHAEKFLPRLMRKAARGENLPVYGEGRERRCWLAVEDHCEALLTIAQGGRVGSAYHIAGDDEWSNRELASEVLRMMRALVPEAEGAELEFVENRPGHDARYALDDSRLRKELGWRPKVKFEDGLRRMARAVLRGRADWIREDEKRRGGPPAK
ncbi:MAG: dTDP-glucose 4,6-dehydratase [Verrucomicrobiota bacterium]